MASQQESAGATFAEQFLPREAVCPDFINADLIARGLSPFAPERAALQAGKVMLAQMAQKVHRGESFAFETTLSGRNYVRHIREWKRAGYHVTLIFLSLPSADVAVARVKSRVRQGGHNVPEEVIRRRFDAGLRLFVSTYRDLVDSWVLYDNSGPAPRRLAAGATNG